MSAIFVTRERFAEETITHCAAMHNALNTPASAVAHHTTAPVQPGAEWLRVSDVKKLFRLSRSLTYELIKDGALRSVCLRRKGRQSGIRLIATDSIRAYIASFEQAAQ